MIRNLHSPVHGMELIYFAIAAGLIYAALINKPVSEVEVIGITGLGGAAFAVGARLLDALGEWAIANKRVHDSLDDLKQWLLPEPLTWILSIIGNLSGKLLAGALIAALLYTFDGMTAAVLPALLVGGASLAIYVILDLLFWLRLWKHLLRSNKRRSHKQPVFPNFDQPVAAGLALGWFHTEARRPHPDVVKYA